MLALFSLAFCSCSTSKPAISQESLESAAATFQDTDRISAQEAAARDARPQVVTYDGNSDEDEISNMDNSLYGQPPQGRARMIEEELSRETVPQWDPAP